VAAAIVRDGSGRPSLLEQEGWSIRYVYPDAAGDLQRPRRLDLTQDGQRIRMVIDEWREPSPR
jgi:outer membrane biogenesis lipoprotein LolB